MTSKNNQTAGRLVEKRGAKTTIGINYWFHEKVAIKVKVNT